MKKFLKKGDVKEVFKQYDEVLQYFFSFYCRSEHHGIGRDYEVDMRTMNYKEFVRFSYQTGIVPTLIPVEDVVHTFHRLMRECLNEFPDSDEARLQVLNFDFFKRALVRIAALGQANLGGQKNAVLEKKMEEENEKREKDKEQKAKLERRYQKQMKKI